MLPAGEAFHAVFVQAREQLFDEGGFSAFCARHREAKRSELRANVIERLRAASKRTSESLKELCLELQEAQELTQIVPTWIVNGFFCRATKAACQRLAAHEAVDFVFRQTLFERAPRTTMPMGERQRTKTSARLDEVRKHEDQVVTREALASLQIPWNLARVGAPEAWKLSSGRGVVIAMIDSGVCDTPCLTRALWRNRGEEVDGVDNDGNGYVDDVFGWDVANSNGYVISDDSGHGSMCASIAAGRPIEGSAQGVAPNARLMVLRGGGRLESYEYALANGADVVSMSYMWPERRLGNYRAVYRLAHEHLCAAGIVAVGGAGNFARTAPVGEQIALPKDIPCVLAVAGILEGGKLSPQSSRGPVSWAGVRSYESDVKVLKPDVTACFGGFPVWAPRTMRLRNGWEVLATSGDGQKIVGPRGNSFAGPHVAGIAALMLEVAPELVAWRIQDAIRATSRDLGDEGPDVEYGHGLVHAATAVERARVEAKR